jgi:hypothetical protein
MPISEAPKDGTVLLVFGGGEYAHVRWISYDNCRGEWSLVNTGDYATSSNLDFTPTHFQHLPKPPKGEA